MTDCEYSQVNNNTTNINLTNIVGRSNASREYLKKMYLKNCEMYGIITGICTVFTFGSVFINTTDLILLFLNLFCLLCLLLYGACELKENLRLTDGGQIFNLETLKNLQIFWCVFKIIVSTIISFVFVNKYKVINYIFIILQYLFTIFAISFETYNFFVIKKEIETNILDEIQHNDNPNEFI